jgi:hypothetical protein
MAVAGLGFVALRKAPAASAAATRSLASYVRAMPPLWRSAPDLRALVAAENVASLHRMGATPADAALYTMVWSLGGALSNALWRPMNDRLGSASAPPCHRSRSCASRRPVALVFALPGAATNSRTLAFNNVLVDISPPDLRATNTGLVGTLTAPSLVLPMLGGARIAATGFGAVFGGVSAALALTLLVLTFGGRARALAGPPKG